MAVKEANSNYKSFTFNGISAADYGVYVTDVNVFNSAERAVEYITIPGRNGSFALDHGRFENITVEYECALGQDTDVDFATAISDFRNALAAAKGYQRLEDDMNPDEYRMAVFSKGLEAPTLNQQTATFKVEFDCKPQRYLKSGEIPRTIGGSVTNTKTESGSVVSIESDGGDAVTSLIAQIEPVQAGSGDPSPTNVRPITGWTQTKVFNTGKNLADESTAIGYNAAVTVDGGYISVTKNASSNYPAAHINIYLRAGVTYTVSATCVQATEQAKLAIRDIAPSNTTVASITGYFTDGQRKSITYTPPKSGMYRVALFSSFGADDSNTAIFTDIQCEIGSTATAYDPYTGTTTTTALGRTVYGGTVDVVTGVLTVTHAMVDLGALTWTRNTSEYSYPYFYSGGISNFAQTTMLCSHYAYVGGGKGGLTRNNVISYYSSTSTRVAVRDDSYTDATSFKSAMSGVNLVYKLVTPQTYNLTAQQVELLTGDNNVWADTGDTTLTYGRDPNKIVNPTLFDASPLIECGGTGTIDIAGQTITLTNDPFGRILLANGTRDSGAVWVDFSTTRLAAGDGIYTERDGTIAFDVTGTGATRNVTAITNVVASGAATTVSASSIADAAQFVVKFGALAFENGTASTQTASVSFTMTYENGGTTSTGNYTVSFDIDYDGGGEIAYCSNRTDNLPTYFSAGLRAVSVPALYGDSTLLPITGTLYFDTDIGEAYTEIGGDIVSVNNAVDFGTNLPVLNPGTNTIAYDNTITNFKIVPRWWVV